MSSGVRANGAAAIGVELKGWRGEEFDGVNGELYGWDDLCTDNLGSGGTRRDESLGVSALGRILCVCVCVLVCVGELVFR